jgi:hypothetical protein
MSPRSKRDYVEAIFLQYKHASRKEKTTILDQFCTVCGYHRKHAIRVLRRFRRFTKPQPRKRGRPSRYHTPVILNPLKTIWVAANLPCSKRLKAILPLWLPGYDQHFDALCPDAADALLRISPATIDRVLKSVRVSYRKRGRATTKPGTLLRKHIPILPFALRGFDCDNGSEFLNHHLLRHFTERKQPIQFTRSRAYHKDDNAHVEQKNWTHVREWLGYERLADPGIVVLLNELYTTEWRLFHNFFCPSMKLIAKERIGSKTLKRHDSPKTPYQRIMESPHIGETVKKTLTKQLSTLNPFVLREAMESKLKEIFEACYSYEQFSQRSLSSVG